MTVSRIKDVILYSSWGLLFVFSFFRYQLWRIFDHKYCSEDNLLTIAKATLKPDNWLFLATFVLTIVVAVRLYAWADSHRLWFSHYGRMVTVGLLFIVLLLISWGCG